MSRSKPLLSRTVPRWIIPVLLLASLTCAALACSREPSRVFENEVVTVACANCVFGMEDVGGCPWAAEIEGKHYLMQGDLPEDHGSHQADGICNMAREAVIDGVLEDGRLTVTRIELLPAAEVPEAGAHADHDAHQH